jgi:hypothetical protein
MSVIVEEGGRRTVRMAYLGIVGSFRSTVSPRCTPTC